MEAAIKPDLFARPQALLSIHLAGIAPGALSFASLSCRNRAPAINSLSSAELCLCYLNVFCSTTTFSLVLIVISARHVKPLQKLPPALTGDEAVLAKLANGKRMRSAAFAGVQRGGAGPNAGQAAAQLLCAVGAVAGGSAGEANGLECLALDHTALPSCGEACMEELLKVRPRVSVHARVTQRRRSRAVALLDCTGVPSCGAACMAGLLKVHS